MQFVWQTPPKVDDPEVYEFFKAIAEALKNDYLSGEDIGRYVGAGSPEGVITANVGSIYQRTDGGASTSFYVKESGDDTNTGWIAK